MHIERKWVGILIGACIVSAGFYIQLLVQVPGYGQFFMPLLALGFLTGGFISGIYFAETLWNGIWSGLLSGVIGTLFITVGLAGFAIHSALSYWDGETGGMLVFTGISIFVGASILAAVGGGIGIVMKKLFHGE